MNLSVLSEEGENFRQFARKFTLQLGSRQPGLHRIHGDNRTNERMGANDAGKSQTLNALCWCLTGKTVDGRPTTSVQPWGSKKKPRVAVRLDRDGKQHVVERVPGGQGLTLDGKTVGQEDLEALTGLSHALLTQAVIMGQGQSLFFDLKPAEKMALLSDTLGWGRWDRRAEAASARARKLEARLAELTGELRGLEAARDGAQDALGAAQERATRWGEERAGKLEETRQAARAGRVRADSLRERRDEAALAADKAGTAAKLLRPDVEASQAAMRECEELGRTAASENEQARRELKKLEAQLAQFSGATCPTCGQAVTKKNATEHSRKLRGQITSLRKTISTSEESIKLYQADADRVEQDITADLGKLQTLEKDEERAESEQRSLDRELAAAQAEAAAAEKALAELEEEANPHREAVAQARRSLAQAKKDHAALEERCNKVEASAERARFWVKGFKDIQLSLVDEVLVDLTETTAAMLEALGVGDWEASYKTERETKSGTTQRALHVDVAAPTSDGPRGWGDWSGGASQRLRLAGALALSEVLLAHAGLRVDVRFLDEPTRSLSPEGVEDLCRCLADYAEEAGLRVYLIDHMAIDSTIFASNTLVVRDETGAWIEER